MWVFAISGCSAKKRVTSSWSGLVIVVDLPQPMASGKIRNAKNNAGIFMAEMTTFGAVWTALER
jgi:hypothetical protein